MNEVSTNEVIDNIGVIKHILDTCYIDQEPNKLILDRLNDTLRIVKENNTQKSLGY